MKILKKIGSKIIEGLCKFFDVFMFVLTGKSDQCVEDGTHDFGGQGRDKFGK